MQPPTHGIARTTLNRRAALALPLAQIVVGLTGAGLLAWLVERAAALAFLAGAVVIALGYAAFAWRTAWRSAVAPAAQVFGRMLVGTLLKWLVIGAGLVLSLTVAGLPAGFVLAGALSALLAYLICLPWLLR